MKTQEELVKKLRHELLDTYYNDPDCLEEIEDLLEQKNYKELLDGYEVEGVRICSECGKLMDEGYCIESGMNYYCSDECLHKNMSEEEYLELYANGSGDSYWTEWEYEQ